jgi:hypothetical protein
MSLSKRIEEAMAEAVAKMPKGKVNDPDAVRAAMMAARERVKKQVAKEDKAGAGKK